MQSQIVCGGCRSVLMYPRGATNVCCALCNVVTPVMPPPGLEMAQLICGGCRTLIMYTRGATSIRCSCCHTVNLAPERVRWSHGDAWCSEGLSQIRSDLEFEQLRLDRNMSGSP